MTWHTHYRYSAWEKIAGLDEGPLTTQCGIDFWDLSTGDGLTQDLRKVDCAGCLALTPADQEEALVRYLEKASTRGPFETNSGWALRVLKEREHGG